MWIIIFEHDTSFVLYTFQISNYLKVYNQILPGDTVCFDIIQPTLHAKKLLEMVQSLHSTAIQLPFCMIKLEFLSLSDFTKAFYKAGLSKKKNK